MLWGPARGEGWFGVGDRRNVPNPVHDPISGNKRKYLTCFKSEIKNGDNF